MSYDHSIENTTGTVEAEAAQADALPGTRTIAASERTARMVETTPFIPRFNHAKRRG